MKSQTYQLVDDVLFQKVDDETVILEPKTGQYFTLDAIGSFMVEHLNKGLLVSDVVALVNETYEVKDNDVESDLNELITNLLSQGILKAQAVSNE